MTHLKKLFLVVLVGIVSGLFQPAHAVIEVLEIRRVSSRVLIPILGEQLTVFGGTAGPLCSPLVPTELCDSCERLAQIGGDDQLRACNRQRIFDDLLIQFEIRSNTTGGFPILRTNQSEIIPARNTLVIQPVGAVQILEVRWGDICRWIGTGNTSCETAQGQVQLAIGVTPERDQPTGGDTRAIVFRVGGPRDGEFDTNEGCGTDGEGICAFTAFPGDGKVFITDLESGRGFPRVSGLDAQFLRVFVSEDGFIRTPADSLEPQDLRISSTGGDLALDKRVVDRLRNGTRYYFRAATVDEAGNVANFTGNDEIVDACGSLEDPSPTCPYAARPDEVLGLLTDDFNCFVASATLGNPLAPSIEILREFRSKILQQFAWGKQVIRWYYKEGPYAARWVADRPWAKVLLTPVIWGATGVAWVVLQLGPFAFFLCVMSLLLVASYFFPNKSRRAEQNRIYQ